MLMFPSKSFLVLTFKIQLSIHVELIFVYGVWDGSQVILLHVDIQLSQCHLLKRLLLLYKIALTHAGLRNNTEQYLAHFAQFSPMVTFCKTTFFYGSLDIDIDMIHSSYSDFPVLFILICGCVCVRAGMEQGAVGLLSPTRFYHLCGLVYPNSMIKVLSSSNATQIPHVALLLLFPCHHHPCLSLTLGNQ